MSATAANSIRKSLPLSPRDVEDLTRLKESDAFHQAIRDLTSVEVNAQSSEASLLHAVLLAGLQAIEQQIQNAGYREMAAEFNRASRKKVARRREPVWAAE